MTDHTQDRARILEAIDKERERQVENGYDHVHDSGCHSRGELAMAAGLPGQLRHPVPALAGVVHAVADGQDVGAQDARPDRKRQLIVAAALLVAELERLERGGRDGRLRGARHV